MQRFVSRRWRSTHQVSRLTSRRNPAFVSVLGDPAYRGNVRGQGDQRDKRTRVSEKVKWQGFSPPQNVSRANPHRRMDLNLSSRSRGALLPSSSSNSTTAGEEVEVFRLSPFANHFPSAAKRQRTGCY
ncbi:hypothetical protein F2P81_002249 [Scophthalmus maximus]|uniref:Uncharacterized protein n=1 Tax=Scophthalmus maximus TaxID=52904 RepID=A0A6A4TQ69_SCOMX|nr:hypothetical protein F2P81_002249 [Scophthalmus maximus]